MTDIVPILMIDFRMMWFYLEAKVHCDNLRVQLDTDVVVLVVVVVGQTVGSISSRLLIEYCCVIMIMDYDC